MIASVVRWSAIDWLLRNSIESVDVMIPEAHVARHARQSLPPPWFDEDGFLAEGGDWTPSLAERIASEAGVVELTTKHWEVIHLVRERYYTIGALPVMRLVCRAVGLDPSMAHKLFASCTSLWRIAGLPNPGEEAKSYMN